MVVDQTQLEAVCEPVLRGLGYDLVALEFGREQQGWVLRVFIEGFESEQISHEDCARCSRDLSAALDVANLIDRAYALEVSSPGLDRPLRRERDFARFIGQKAYVRTRDPVDGRRNFTGTLRGALEGRVQIECEGRLYEVALSEVAKANLQYEPGEKQR